MPNETPRPQPLTVAERKYNAAMQQIIGLQDNLFDLQAQAQAEIEARDQEIVRLNERIQELEGNTGEE